MLVFCSYRREAMTVPKTVVSAIDPRKFDEKQTSNVRPTHLDGFPPCAPQNLPTRQWQRRIVAEFSQLREKLDAIWEQEEEDEEIRCQMPAADDYAGWMRFCFGYCEPASEPCNPTVPTVTQLLQLDQITYAALLGHISSFVASQPFQQVHSLWLYAVFANIQKPLLPDVSAMIRSMVRYCVQQRAALPANDDRDSAAVLAALNIVITLGAQYFGQASPEEIGT
eukprot:TRINITY_DN3587_c0_g1_i1.p1 TRINITY_DN3587_c0_g1~~TRINITY_DN3587_c0_g1_i1.p1  ORF type:complete len:224 (+),score=48.22 TRINITY_DN3587_c0_g1_i1:196-867(+)